jgi:hypothetical protein
MKYPFSNLSVFLGALVGIALWFAFYKITGIDIALLSAATIVRKLADVISAAAFATFGTVMISWLFFTFSSRTRESDNRPRSNV